MQLTPVQIRKVIQMIKYDESALTFKPVYEWLKLLSYLFLMLSTVVIYEKFNYSLIIIAPILTLIVAILFLKKMAEIFSYGDVNNPLDSNEYVILDAVLKRNSEVEQHISQKINKGIKLTKRDFYYLNISELHKNIIREGYMNEINLISLEQPDQTNMVNGVLENLSISSPITFEDDAKSAKKTKIKNALLFVAFSAIFSFTIYTLQFYDVDTRFRFFPVVAICFLLALIFAANIFFMHKNLIEENLLGESDYEKIRQLSKVDIKTVEYLKQIKDQGRLLYSIDSQAMSLDKRYAAFQDIKYATMWEKS